MPDEQLLWLPDDNACPDLGSATVTVSPTGSHCEAFENVSSLVCYLAAIPDVDAQLLKLDEHEIVVK